VSLDVARKLALPPSVVFGLAVERLAFPTGELFEELVFRGVLLSEFLALWCPEGRSELSAASLRIRAWLANVAASVVFVGLHWPYWIYTQGIGEQLLVNTAGVFLISLVLGMVFISSRSLWPCVLLHWINNTLSGLVG
jgi:membrane protease YdiL (CAAX protease family)